MATREEMFTALRAADAAGATEDAQRIAQMIAAMPKAEPESTPNPAEGMSATDRFMTGAGGAAARLRHRIFPPASPIQAFTMDQTTDNGRARKDDLATYEANRGALGTAGAAGEIASEVALSSVPVGKVGSLAGRVLTRTLGRMAPAVGDIAANAGYAALTAEDGKRGEAALAGGAGAAGGRVLIKTLGGVATGARKYMSPEARTLMEHGVQPTPGQMFGDGIVRRIEDKLTSAPLAGDIVTGARTRGMNQYNTVEINRALKPLGVAVTGAGEDAVEAASRAVSDAYDRVLPNVYMLPSSVMQATNAARASIKKIPLIDGAQEAKVGGYILQRIDPVIEAAQHGPIDGKTFKALDAEIGHYAREFSKTADPSHHALGEAFYELQTALRGALDAKTPDAGKLLKDTNAAYRNLLPVVKASDRAMAQGGRFTPLQLNRAAGQFGQEGSELNQAARRVLPNTIPNSGTADRIGIGAAFAAPVKTTVATSVAAVLYSRPGMALFIDGLSAIAPPGAIDAIKRLPPEGQRAAIEAFIREAPQIGGPLAAQVGRALATQEAAQ